METSQEVSSMRSRGRGGGFTVRDDTTRTIGDGDGILLVLGLDWSSLHLVVQLWRWNR
jgi:hypothetical protein